VARVKVAIRVDSSSLVAAIAVEIKSRLELKLDLICAPGKGCEDVSLNVLGYWRG
jgi:hypothetical protein